MAALGDFLYRGSSVWKRLTGNITATKQFLSQTGSGAASAAPAWSGIAETDLSFTDVVTSNSSTTKHGFLKKLSNVATEYMGGDGNWSVPAGGSHAVCEGRLTLTTATPVTTADVTAAGSIFFTPYKGNHIGTYSGSAWTVSTFTEKTLTVPAVGTQMYDVFIVDSTLALEALAWTNDTTRATALVLQDGVLVKSGATTRRYLGSFRTVAASQTDDTLAKRLLWNYYNRVRRPLRVLEATDSWTYSTDAFQQARASTANQVAAVVGVAEVDIDIYLNAASANSNVDISRSVAIGEGSTTTPATGCVWQEVEGATAAKRYSMSARVSKHAPLGYQFWTWLERSVATITTTWYGDNGGTRLQSGLIGSVEG